MHFFYRLSQKMWPGEILNFWRKPDNPLFRVFAKISKSQPAPSFGSDGQKSSCHTFLKAFNPLFRLKKKISKNYGFLKSPERFKICKISKFWIFWGKLYTTNERKFWQKSRKNGHSSHTLLLFYATELENGRWLIL